MKIRRQGQPTINLEKVEMIDSVDEVGPPPSWDIVFNVGGREYRWRFDDPIIRDDVYNRIQNLWGCTDLN